MTVKGTARTTNLASDPVYKTATPGTKKQMWRDHKTARAKALLAQERKRAQRIAGDAPVTTFLVGDGEGDTIELKRLQVSLTKLPSKLSKTEVPKLARKYAGLDKGNLSTPKGYIPPGGRQR